MTVVDEHEYASRHKRELDVYGRVVIVAPALSKNIVLHIDVLLHREIKRATPVSHESAVDQQQRHATHTTLSRERHIAGEIGHQAAIEREVVVDEARREKRLAHIVSVKCDALEEERCTGTEYRVLVANHKDGHVGCSGLCRDESKDKRVGHQRDIGEGVGYHQILRVLAIEDDEANAARTTIAAIEPLLDGRIGAACA